MGAFSRWWDGLPAVVRRTLGLAAVAIGYGTTYVVVATTSGLDSDDDDLLIRLLIVALAVPLTIAGTFHQRRRLGGKGQLGLYRRAYRTGTVPEGANLEKWRPIVRKQARFFREGRRLVLGMWCLFAVVLIVAAVAVFMRGSGAGFVAIAVFAVVVAAVAWGTDRLWRWRQRQFSRLEHSLDGR